MYHFLECLFVFGCFHNRRELLRHEDYFALLLIDAIFFNRKNRLRFPINNFFPLIFCCCCYYYNNLKILLLMKDRKFYTTISNHLHYQFVRVLIQNV